jgi:hypothetical protein
VSTLGLVKSAFNVFFDMQYLCRGMHNIPFSCDDTGIRKCGKSLLALTEAGRSVFIRCFKLCFLNIIVIEDSWIIRNV